MTGAQGVRPSIMKWWKYHLIDGDGPLVSGCEWGLGEVVRQVVLRVHRTSLLTEPCCSSECYGRSAALGSAGIVRRLVEFSQLQLRTEAAAPKTTNRNRISV